VSSAVCPAALQLTFDRRGFIINQLELMAVLCCLLTYGEWLRGRRVLWFIDNCSAMSSCVHGYASKLDMARMANAVQMALCGLDVRAHFEWVPSDANISDIPSRVDSISEMDQDERKVWTELGLPGEGEWDAMRFPPPRAAR
jgi:hypothetical protein